MIAGLNLDIRIGRVSVRRVPDLWIMSERQLPLTQMRITLPDPTGEIYRTVQHKDPVSITLGYRDQTPTTWTGTVLASTDSQVNDQVVINSVGPERPLTETLIKQSFVMESPEAIVKFAIEQSGLPVGTIEPTGIVFPRFIASTIPVWQVARQCERTCQTGYGKDMSAWAIWMGRDGKVNWGSFDEPGDLPVIESQHNLIKHSPGECPLELSRVTTFMLPHIMHSMKFRLKDYRRGINRDFRALKVHHRFQAKQARTLISYGQANERY